MFDCTPNPTTHAWIIALVKEALPLRCGKGLDADEGWKTLTRTQAGVVSELANLAPKFRAVGLRSQLECP